MRRSYCVLFVLLFLLGSAPAAFAQSTDGSGASRQQESGFELGQNYPNPFNPETKIPFELNEGAFVDGRPAVVTIRILNILQQLVASPTALGHPRGDGVPLLELSYSLPGRYEAYWDGRDQAGAQVASGVYFVQLVVNGESRVRKMFVTK